MAGDSQVKIQALGAEDDGGEKKARSSARSASREQRADAELHGRLSGMFGRIAERLRERGDDELAEIVMEDAEVLAGGLVSFTRPFRFARTLVLGGVAIIEPLLAFWRIARELLMRHAERRAQKREERERVAADAQ